MSDHSTAVRLGVVASMKRGLEQFVHRELTHLERVGVRVTLFPTKQGPGLYGPRDSWRVVRWTLLGLVAAQPAAFARAPGRYLHALGVALRHGALADFLLAARFSAEVLEVDVLYSTFGDRKLFVGYFAKLLTGKPLFTTTHAYEIYDNPNPGLFRIAVAACDQLVTISDYNRHQLEQRFGFPAGETEVVPCSIDLEEYRPRQKFVVLIVGFFVERKGHEVLFQAVKQLGDPSIEVWVVGGEGAEADSVDVRGLAERHGVESQVAFLGKLSGVALRAVYHACDVFCLPCHFDRQGVGEGFPTVIIEAMACGKPVVSTRHVAIPSVLDEVLVEEKDVDGLAAALGRLRKSPELRAELGRRNRELAEQRFSPGNVEQTAAIARRLCGRDEAETGKFEPALEETPPSNGAAAREPLAVQPAGGEG